MLAAVLFTFQASAIFSDAVQPLLLEMAPPQTRSTDDMEQHLKEMAQTLRKVAEDMQKAMTESEARIMHHINTKCDALEINLKQHTDDMFSRHTPKVVTPNPATDGHVDVDRESDGTSNTTGDSQGADSSQQQQPEETPNTHHQPPGNGIPGDIPQTNGDV